jgi:hypothetical protein
LTTGHACSECSVVSFAEGLLGAAPAPGGPLGVEVGAAENIGGVQ